MSDCHQTLSACKFATGVLMVSPLRTGAQQEGAPGEQQPQAADTAERLLRAAAVDTGQANSHCHHHPCQRSHCRCRIAPTIHRKQG